jgi:hypothetical protein
MDCHRIAKEACLENFPELGNSYLHVLRHSRQYSLFFSEDIFVNMLQFFKDFLALSFALGLKAALA